MAENIIVKVSPKKLSTELRGAKVSNEDKFALHNGLELSLKSHQKEHGYQEPAKMIRFHL